MRHLAWMLIGLGWLTAAAAAQETPYPDHTVRIVAPAAAGGNPDVLARLLANRLSQRLGQAFVVEDVPGAGGVVAAKRVTAAPGDGYLLMDNDSGALAIAVAMNPDANYNPLKDFTPITALARVPTVLVVHPSVPAKTVAEFVALAKAKPNGMSFGSAGPGSIHHLTQEIFAERAGIALLHVPYRGGTALVNGLLAGEIQAGWSGIPNVLSLIRTGQLRALCLSVLARSPSLPDVPTCAEEGYPGFDVADVIGLQAGAGTPPAVVARLQAAVADSLREPEMMERMLTLGMEVQWTSTAEYVRFMQDDLERYGVLVKRLGLRMK